MANPNKKVKVNEDALERLANDVIRQQEKRDNYSRRRMKDEDETVTYINKRNEVFNEKLERVFGKVSSGIKTAM